MPRAGSVQTVTGPDLRMAALAVQPPIRFQRVADASTSGGRPSLPNMRMLHLELRVSDLEQSLAFYTALNYAELGRVPRQSSAA
jgi:hypothetical protein